MASDEQIQPEKQKRQKPMANDRVYQHGWLKQSGSVDAFFKLEAVWANVSPNLGRGLPLKDLK